MKFIKCDELKPGMRLAKPIYSKKGVLLYDRASVLRDMQSIENIKSFGLIGLFILEPAEPVPPMTQEDLEFERFQTVMYNEIMDEYARRVQDFRMRRFKVADNLPNLESQVKADVRAEYSYEEDLFPTNVPGEAKSLAKTYELAINKAYDMARENLANEIVHEIMLQFIHKDFVKHFGAVKGQEMVQAILDSKGGILDRIGDMEKVLELYNSKNTTSSEVIVKVYYNGIQAKEDFKMALKEVLKNDETLYNEMTYFLDTVKAKK